VYGIFLVGTSEGEAAVKTQTSLVKGTRENSAEKLGNSHGRLHRS
jgi:hypothetical protein